MQQQQTPSEIKITQEPAVKLDPPPGDVQVMNSDLPPTPDANAGGSSDGSARGSGTVVEKPKTVVKPKPFKEQIGSAVSARLSDLMGCFNQHPADMPAKGTSITAITRRCQARSERVQTGHLFALVNMEREGAGLPGLSWNGNVAVVAREQSQAARDGRDVDLESTFRARIAMMGATNFAKAEAVTDAHAAFMQSTSQRANVLSHKFNEIGIGVVEEASGGIIATEILVRAIPKLDTASFAKRLRKDLVNYELGTSSDLDAIAQTFADALAAGKTTDAIWPSVRSRISEIERRYVKIDYSVLVSSDVSEIQWPQLFGSQKKNNDIGIGVAQGTDRQLGSGAIHVVIVIGVPLYR
jgi:hypothetical protein